MSKSATCEYSPANTPNHTNTAVYPDSSFLSTKEFQSNSRNDNDNNQHIGIDIDQIANENAHKSHEHTTALQSQIIIGQTLLAGPEELSAGGGHADL